MRKFLSLLFLLLAAFVACEEQPNVEVKKPELVLLSSETMLFEAQGGSGEIAYSLKNGVDGKSVEASCDADWVTDIAVADKIAFRVLANDKEELRTATITVSYDELSFVVNLRQAAAEPQPEPDHVVELVADKSYIKSDGEDCVTFTVFVDEQEVTTGYSITNVTTDELLEGNTFVSTEAGEYKFKATYGEYSSNEVSISVEGLDGCEVPVITADKMEIKADGVDVVTFTVTYNGEDVTAESEIKCLTTGKLLEGNTFTTTEAGEYRFDAMCDASVERSIEIAIVATATEPEPDPIPTIVLEADKLSIVADGEDKVTFTVKSDDNTLSEGFEIINLADKEPLAAAEFTTTTAGEYSFKAKVGDAESEVVKITATELEASIVLSADKTTIVADGVDAVTFSTEVKNILTEDTLVIINLADNSEVNGTFTTTIAGTYSFQAKKGGVESNVITITATEVAEDKELVLSVSPGTIKADGTDIATFTVKYGEDDVTSQAAIYNNGSALNGTTFSTTTAGSYTFKALYDNKESNEVTITAEQVAEPEPPVGDYAVGTFYNNNGVKGIVFGTKVIGEDTYCYIVSLDQKYIQWSTENVQCGCFNPADGSKNVMSIKYVDSTLEKYPAAKWCEDHGEGWYLPASNELHMLWDAVSGNKHVFKNNPDVEKFNKALTDNGGTAIQETFYWTSNEVSDSIAEVVCFSDGKGVCLNIEKSMQYDVRAIYKFKIK